MPYGTDSVDVSIEMAVAVFQTLSYVLARHPGRKPAVASSYGYAAPLSDPAVVLSLMQVAVEACGYTGRIAYALDCASTETYDRESGTYLLHDRRVSSGELIDYARSLTEPFDMVFIEDLLDENDWDGYARAACELPRTIVLGDDLTVTSPALLRRAHG